MDKEIPEKWRNASAEECVAQIESCHYEYEGGPLELNCGYIRLKQIMAQDSDNRSAQASMKQSYAQGDWDDHGRS